MLFLARRLHVYLDHQLDHNLSSFPSLCLQYFDAIAAEINDLLQVRAV